MLIKMMGSGVVPGAVTTDNTSNPRFSTLCHAGSQSKASPVSIAANAISRLAARARLNRNIMRQE
jgi:hypothetical protein